jgi:hypothetical protein
MQTLVFSIHLTPASIVTIRSQNFGIALVVTAAATEAKGSNI